MLETYKTSADVVGGKVNNSNKNKKKLLLIGNWNKAKAEGFDQRFEEIKLLGTWFGEKGTLGRKNWEELIGGIRERLEPYRRMDKSVYARAKNFNSVAMTTYAQQALTNNFRKKGKVKRNYTYGKIKMKVYQKKQLYSDVEKGELGLKNINCEETNYRAQMIGRLQRSKDPGKEFNEIALGKERKLSQ